MHEFMVNNIEANLSLAAPNQVNSGIEWYMRGNMILRDIQEETGHSLNHVAAAMAHISPRLSWTANVKGTWAVCLGLPTLSGIMLRSYEMAANALNSSDPLATLNGPKTSRFAKNLLLLDMNAVTCDVWALRGAGVPDLKLDGSKKGLMNYAAVERAFQEVARNHNLLPAHLQAIVWTVVRDNWKRGN